MGGGEEQTIPSRDFFLFVYTRISVQTLLCVFSFSSSPNTLPAYFSNITQLGPPYHILVDTNFINFSIKAKLDLVQSMMDCLYAKCEYQTFSISLTFVKNNHTHPNTLKRGKWGSSLPNCWPFNLLTINEDPFQ